MLLGVSLRSTVWTARRTLSQHPRQYAQLVCARGERAERAGSGRQRGSVRVVSRRVVSSQRLTHHPALARTRARNRGAGQTSQRACCKRWWREESAFGHVQLRRGAPVPPARSTTLYTVQSLISSLCTDSSLSKFEAQLSSHTRTNTPHDIIRTSIRFVLFCTHVFGRDGVRIVLAPPSHIW